MTTFLAHAWACRPRRAASATCAAASRSRWRPAARSADSQLRRNLGKATATIRAKRAAVVAELPDWEQLRDGRARRSRPRPCAHLDRYLEQLEAEVTARGGDRALGPGRDRGQPDRDRPGPRDRGHARWSRSSRMVTDEIGLNDALAARGHHRPRDRPGRADRAARPRPALAHPGARHPPQPGRDPGDLPARDGRRRPGADRRARPRWPRRPGCTCGAGSCPPGSASAAPTSPSPRPARCAWSSPRATAGCA